MRYIFYYSLLLVVCLSASAQEGTIKDIDGNVYKTVKIGTQVWMAENLKTAHYRDGSPITETEDSIQWIMAGQSQRAAWCYYDNNAKNNPIYGKLYNWYSVADQRHLCPTGWHVPSQGEWTVLIDILGGDSIAGGKMKATKFWNDPNLDASNSSGFSAVPAGRRFGDGAFSYIDNYCYLWISTEISKMNAWHRLLYSGTSYIYIAHNRKGNGLSVRCVGD